MDRFSWEPFLRQWSRELAVSDVVPADVMKDASPTWLGYPGAAQARIAQAEARLGATFPPSYRTFLTGSNGWRWLDYFIGPLWSTEDIDWFRARHQDWIDMWVEQDETPPMTDDEYLVYGDEQVSAAFRRTYLQTALEISMEQAGAILLLNPRVVTDDGEWEAWFFADWNPGARRYRSFQALMQAHYALFTQLKKSS